MANIPRPTLANGSVRGSQPWSWEREVDSIAKSGVFVQRRDDKAILPGDPAKDPLDRSILDGIQYYVVLGNVIRSRNIYSL